MLSPHFYSSIVSNSTDLISVIDLAGNYSYVGSSVKHILGYDAEELLGRNAFDYIHPDDISKTAESLASITAHKKLHLAPFRFRDKDGSWHWLACSITNMLDNEAVQGFVTNSRDITETVTAEFVKEQSQAYFESLFFEHPDAVFTLDERGLFQQVNRHVAKIIGVPEAKIIGKDFIGFLHPDAVARTVRAFEQVNSGVAQTIEACIYDAQGQQRDLNITLLPVYFRGAVIGIEGVAKDITESKKSERIIKEQADQLFKIIESITEPFVALDEAWCFTYVNKPFLAFMGKGKEQLLNNSIWDLYENARDTLFYHKCHEVAESKVTATFEETYEQFGGRTLSYSIFPADGGIAVHFIDVTAQKSVQTELEKLSLVASKTTNGIIITDKAGKIEWVNEGFTRITGYTLPEVLHKKPGDVLQNTSTSKDSIQRIRKNLKKAVPFSEEILNSRKSGEHFWVSMDITPIVGEAGDVIKYIAIETDITEKKEAEAELLKLTDDLFKQNRDLQQFAYITSHNLRAPIANALGLTNLIQRLGKDSDIFDGSMAKLQQSVSQLDTIIKDVSHILSIRDASTLAPREPVNIMSTCREVLVSLEDKFTAIQAGIKLDVPDELVLTINRAYFYNILHNLLSNAIKYRAHDRPLELYIGVERDARGYVFSVSDNGLGMDMHLVKSQLFKLYKRFHPNTHGRGIGLFLVKTQVEAMGGKIEAESSAGKGTTFRIYISKNHV